MNKRCKLRLINGAGIRTPELDLTTVTMLTEGLIENLD